MAGPNQRVISQFGALPFALDSTGALRVMLVTTRGSRQWVIPKGWPMRNRTPADTAAREAFEEAGLVGAVVEREPFGRYRYAKRRSARNEIYEVAVFLFAVERQLAKWPEKAQRQTRWFDLAEAPGLVAADGLAEMLRAAPHRLAEYAAPLAQ
jgi:8-oxo-dGTP pyrophosphatase MutT (NUDIX family)